MTSEEIEIIEFLKPNPETCYSRKEISRKARRRQEFEENPNWATIPLNSLVNSKHIIQNEQGHYQLSPNFDRM